MRKIAQIFACLAEIVLPMSAGLCTGCSPEQRYSKSVGSFYSLDEAYENGWLTQNDLKNIAYYYHTRHGETDHVDETFIPNPKTPENLSEDTQNKIKRTYLDEVAMVPDGVFERIEISQYFGTYNECVVIGIKSDYIVYEPILYPVHIIGEVFFYDYIPTAIDVWREGKLN